ncbi:thrombospondin type-1 domain-containing protein 1 isoform X1 [Mesocricetus auratus]|uniref:Thrombospondin type-1 domain-containing protein 1 isoform X1 n=1 Tax=Mesocricetus auratus TaxID=10036 RepID=A0A1U7RHZ4_MESAU|nr:thrombospondin type-1 domain-containing protein 1 isoform X1 [Mesocricetus auratus]
MKPMLKDFSPLLLVVLCDYVLGEAEYLLLREPVHVALSNRTVSVDFHYLSDVNGTLRNVSVLLWKANTNQTLTTKHLLTNQSQGTLQFECFYFKEAGDYWFVMSPEMTDNSTQVPGWEKSAFLKVEWPVFHIDLNRTAEATEGTFQVGLFTTQPLCLFPGDKPDLLVDVIFTDSLPEARTRGQPLEIRASKRTELAQGQWVEFGCAPVGVEAYVTVGLTLWGQDSVITSTGPIDLAQKFGYKLTMAPEVTCESVVEVMVLPPPCVFVQGVLTVRKEAPRHAEDRTSQLAENSLSLGQRRTVFNCTLFDVGKNRYCFNFGISRKSHFSAKECMLIQRNIETWGPWQPWSQCSTTCGDAVRERRRVCLSSVPSRPSCSGMPSETSSCSLEECAVFRPPGSSSIPPQDPVKSNNVVTVTGISLCLFIIIATVLITLWRRFGRAPKCSTPARHNSIHSPGFRKNSDEENICELSEPRGSFSDAGDGPRGSPGDTGIPLTYRCSAPAAPDDEASGSESFQSNAQKIIPPLFSYRLAQQQLKEMKKKGLTETTKVYHVSQSPLTDTVVGATASPPLDLECSEEAATASKFRIKSPFLDQPVAGAGERPPSRLDCIAPPPSCAVSPSQTLIRKSQMRATGGREGSSERCHPRTSLFRRTASFHEAKQSRPFRERSLSALTPRQVPAYSSRMRTWDQMEDRCRPPSRSAYLFPERSEHFQGAGRTNSPLGPLSKSYTVGHPRRKPDSGDRQAGLVVGAERIEPHGAHRGPSPSHRSVSRKQSSPIFPKDSYQKVSQLSPSHCRKDKCQSFPIHSEFAFYDNTSFRLTEAEQRMLDLPGYFGSNEEDETTSTLSVEKLVI